MNGHQKSSAVRVAFAVALFAAMSSTACGGGDEVIAGVCGNGVVTPDEACDDEGESDTCTAQCEAKPMIAAGMFDVCGVARDGTLRCWGGGENQRWLRRLRPTVFDRSRVGGTTLAASPPTAERCVGDS